MNVICPECNTTYRVDPAKVPSGGVLAQCARCPATFEVVGAEAGNDQDLTVTVAPVTSGDEEQGTFGVTADIFVGDRGFAGAVDTAGETAEAKAGGEGTAPDGAGGETAGPADNDADLTYVGASDVAFHTEESAPDDLPYLEATIAQIQREPEVANAPVSDEPDQAPGPQAALTGAGADSAPAPENPIGTGEAPLPPAPFGARSDPHRRAARLARALVSDIVVYHPERRTRSLRQGTLRQEFREEIRKSWEEYANQVGGDFARQTTYFRDALNEILADGATVF